MSDSDRSAEKGRVAFEVATLDCIVCTPVFRRALKGADGVTAVKELTLMNKIVVEYEGGKVTEEKVKNVILAAPSKAGLRDKIIFVS